MAKIQNSYGSASFRDFYEDDENVSLAQRAKIEFEVELIGKLIEAREKKGFTQEQLASAAGVKQSAIARLESMRATPQIDTLFKVLTPMGYKLTIVPDVDTLERLRLGDADRTRGADAGANGK